MVMDLNSIEKDPDSYIGKETQSFENVKDLANENQTLLEVITQCEQYLDIPDDWETEFASIVLYTFQKGADKSVLHPMRLFTIQIPLDGFDSLQEAIMDIKSQLCDMEIMKIHSNRMVDSIHNAFYVCETTEMSRIGEYTFGIWLT